MTYRIKPGDSLSRIASAHGVTLAALLDANPRYKANPSFIRPGDEVIIPIAEAAENLKEESGATAKEAVEAGKEFLKDVIGFIAERLEPDRPVATHTDHAAVRAWNRFGSLLKALSERLGIEPELAAAVVAVESGGRGFEAQRMIIRFENHVFHRLWGKDNPQVFDAHFRFDPRERWKGHEWRPAANHAWQRFHGNQDAEWRVFDFACALDDTAAKESISMGLPQIMGFNHARIGYKTVQEMFAAFSTGEAVQLIGFFDFAKDIPGLKSKDFHAFARGYNGEGQAAEYARRMTSAYETLKTVLA
jgi:hypothetical protein